MKKMVDEKPESSEEEKIRSKAIVWYSLPLPEEFRELKCNTDLNLPPANWLSSSADSYGLQQMLFQKRGFSSFTMGHLFPDCVGEVDVVSDAENIKNLLKIPYCKGQVSMMVHRIENTLLLDDFDIYKYLRRTCPEKKWQWLKRFFTETFNAESCNEGRSLYIQKRMRDCLREKALLLKFLYQSLGDKNPNEGVNLTKSQPLSVEEKPLLPEATQATPDSTPIEQKYNRNVVWTFEDIEMLIGTDLPIFGGGTHPCISLRLRDVSKPINVLTGIDYWLDNLMSNVPEVVMCYHLNGIVQKYELIKTEDLPRLDNSKFSPKLIRDVAQSILSFLKSNATKAGHTYWLFKGKDEEVVKLYDLTSLCSENEVEKGQNPFTVPVAMLLYRVALNMKDNSGRQSGTVHMLLKNCIKLLPEEKYPEVVTSSYYMVSDLYIPAKTNPESPCFDQKDADDSDSVYDDDFSDDKDCATRILVLDQDQPFDKFVNNRKSPPPITGTVEERCLQAISHVTGGLNCLQYIHEKAANVEGNKDNEDEVRMAKPSEPIPMPYSQLNESKETGQRKKKHKDRTKKIDKSKSGDVGANALLLKNNNEAHPLPTWQTQTKVPDFFWKQHLKTLLYEKAVLVYATLSEDHFREGCYGKCLRTIGLLTRCQLIMNCLLSTSNSLKEICLLGRAGDCFIMMVQNWRKVDSYRQEYFTNTVEDSKITEQLEKDEQFYNISIGSTNVKCVFVYDFRTIEQILLNGIECYEAALKSCANRSVLTRLGNGLNEVASFYLNKAKSSITTQETIEMCRKAEPYLNRGLAIFQQVKSVSNIALLYTNLGHLFRLLAHANTPVDRGELTTQEKAFFTKAFNNYKRALQVLGERKNCPGVWDAVKWELSTAYFNMGSIMHENPPSNCKKMDAEKQIIEILQKALQYCDFDERSANFTPYQYRAGTIHFRIGSLYHSHIWTTTNDSSNRKNIIQLAKINYEKAAKHYCAALDAVCYFTSQMQRIALFEYLADTTNSVNMKIKHLQHCIEIFVEMNEMFTLVVDNQAEIIEDNEMDDDEKSRKTSFKTCLSLLNLVRSRLQHVFKTLIKLCLSKPPPNKDCTKLADIYKSCYKLSLEIKEDVLRDHLAQNLHKVLREIGDKTTETN